MMKAPPTIGEGRFEHATTRGKNPTGHCRGRGDFEAEVGLFERDRHGPLGTPGNNEKSIRGWPGYLLSGREAQEAAERCRDFMAFLKGDAGDFETRNRRRGRRRYRILSLKARFSELLHGSEWGFTNNMGSTRFSDQTGTHPLRQELSRWQTVQTLLS
jgi:hypothetical protein